MKSLLHLFSEAEFESESDVFFVGMESECLTLVLGIESESDV